MNGPASIDLVATSGGIGETGSVSTALLTGSAATSAALTGTNTITGLGDFTATTGFSLTDTPALSVTGAVNGGTNVTLTDAGALGIGGSVTGTTVDLTGASISISGSVNGPASIDLVATSGGITETGTATLTTPLLTGSAATTASLGTSQTPMANLVVALSTFTAGTSLALTDSEALAVMGIITAPQIIVSTGTNALSFADGTIIDTSGITAPNHLTLGRGGLPVIPPATPPSPGAYFSSGTFTQTGTTQVNLIGGGGPPPNSILSITTVNGGNISLDPSGGINGPGTWLILNLAAAGSHVTGNVNVGQLTVVLPANVGNDTAPFTVALTGSVDGQFGQIAASNGSVIPTRGITLRINNCPIGSVNCVLLSGALVPVTNPLQNLTLGILVAPNDEGDLLLPLVSDEDFLSCLLRSNGSDPNDCN